MSSSLTCLACGKPMAGDYSDGDGSFHFGCAGKAKATSTSSSEASTGGAWVSEGANSKIAFQLLGTLAKYTLQEGDKKFLWGVAAADRKSATGLQRCGSKGSYMHDSTGASRIADRDRSFMSVFFLPATEANRILVHGIGNHVGKNDTHKYKVEWEDGTTKTFVLGSATDS